MLPFKTQDTDRAFLKYETMQLQSDLHTCLSIFFQVFQSPRKGRIFVTKSLSLFSTINFFIPRRRMILLCLRSSQYPSEETNTNIIETKLSEFNESNININGALV